MYNDFLLFTCTLLASTSYMYVVHVATLERKWNWQGGTPSLPPERLEIRQKSNRVTPGKFVRSFDWSIDQALETARKRWFWGGIFSKSAKKQFFLLGRTTGLFLKKTIHSKVFSELLYRQWFLGQLAFSVFTRRLLVYFFCAPASPIFWKIKFSSKV